MKWSGVCCVVREWRERAVSVEEDRGIYKAACQKSRVSQATMQCGEMGQGEREKAGREAKNKKEGIQMRKNWARGVWCDGSEWQATRTRPESRARRKRWAPPRGSSAVNASRSRQTQAGPVFPRCATKAPWRELGPCTVPRAEMGPRLAADQRTKEVDDGP